MTTESGTFWPLVARWTQSTDDGKIHWYVAALRQDRGYWGYAHFRTSNCRENRSFGGTLDRELFDRVTAIVAELSSGPPVVSQGPTEGVIGIGTRQAFHPLFELPCDNPDVPSLRTRALFEEFVQLLQRVVQDSLI